MDLSPKKQPTQHLPGMLSLHRTDDASEPAGADTTTHPKARNNISIAKPTFPPPENTKRKSDDLLCPRPVKMPHCLDYEGVVCRPISPHTPKASNTSSATRPLLLSMPNDEKVLGPLHVFVRKHIEVFAATPVDMKQPSPGRKSPIRLNQVGLRCIHCHDDYPLRQRAKRSISYPTSLGRLYHSVSDMKFDHFSNCKALPENVKICFEKLKQENCRKRPSGAAPSSNSTTTSNGQPMSTVQYYKECARQLGLVDGQDGVFFARDICEPHPSLSPSLPMVAAPPLPLSTGINNSPQFTLPLVDRPGVMPSSSAPAPSLSLQRNETSGVQHTGPSTSRLLADRALDPYYLSPLHCFVRRHVEFFAAQKEDLVAPSSGRRVRILLGQVGLRCIHCSKLPIKERVKRNVCYPPQVSAIYHSVSNMKFEHFSICRGLSPKDRAEFLALRAKKSRAPSIGNNRTAVPTKGGDGRKGKSTFQYYHDSALRMGLVDTRQGIRLGSDIEQTMRQILQKNVTR